MDFLKEPAIHKREKKLRTSFGVKVLEFRTSPNQWRFTCRKMCLTFKWKIESVGLPLEKNIVCLTNDGAAVMQKAGKLIPASQQLCLAHAIQLAVVDALYKKETTKERTFCSNESIDFNSYSDTEERENYGAFENTSNTYEEGLVMDYDIQEQDTETTHSQIGPLIQKVRKTVQIFKRSPLKNEVLQNYIKLKFREEYFLIADSKTRWNSLLAMLERFHKLKSCIQKSDIDLKLNTNFTETDFETVSATISALLRVKLAVESLCCKDTNLKFLRMQH